MTRTENKSSSSWIFKLTAILFWYKPHKVFYILNYSLLVIGYTGNTNQSVVISNALI